MNQKHDFITEHTIYYHLLKSLSHICQDPVTGSAYCALAPYWSQKLGKCDFIAYQASARGGILSLHLDEKNQRVLLRGKPITVMEGTLLV
ncbi:hypothetical protein DITRI_Ditri11bG0095700 [Diplodiscus trichospermus]